MEFKKSILGFITLLFFSLASSAQASGPTIQEVMKVKDEIKGVMFAMKGVNGIGITGCHPITGEINHDAGFDYCVLVTAKTKVTLDALKTLIPTGTRYKDVFIVVRYGGIYKPLPRGTAGN